MGDRTNPIKFGPEWLRNLARERTAASSSSGSNSGASGAVASSGAAGVVANPGSVAGPSHMGSFGAGASGASGSSGRTTINTPGSSNTSMPSATSKVHLAKQRYGREEMLALYDRTVEAPPQLKAIDILYQSRGKPPLALNNTFEEETQENLRSAPPIGGMTSGERFNMGRGRGLNNEARGRALSVGDNRGRGRGYVRTSSTGRGWHPGNPRNSFTGLPDEDANAPRPWSNNNVLNASRSSAEHVDWPKQMYRNKRPGNNTNWRQQHSRDDGEEWRSQDGARPRGQQDKWERDWVERPVQDKQSWNSNRRTWQGDTQNEELPEWAVENNEACGGTFDSSGAFHGYSNDDTNLPKNQESSYPLTRSHTHGSFARSKTVEEGSEEWWASEKAKKLSTKRFDANEIKFKKPPSPETSEAGASTSSTTKADTGKEEDVQDVPVKQDVAAAAPEPSETSKDKENIDEDKYTQKNAYKPKFPESQTFDSLMRSDINIQEATDERGNFQSVMITPNNILRQKHQNMVPAINETMRQNAKSNLLQIIGNTQQSRQSLEVDQTDQQIATDKIVEELFDMSLEDDLTPATMSSLLPMSNAGMSSVMANAMNSLPHLSNNRLMLMRIPNPMRNQVLNINMQNKQNIPLPGMQSTGIQTAVMQPLGMTNSVLNASLGLPIGPNTNMGMPLQGVPPPVMPNTGMPNSGMPNPGMQNSGMPNSIIQNSGMPNSIMHNAGMPNSVMQNSGMPNPGMSNPGMPNTGMSNSNMSNPGMSNSAMPNPGMPNQGMPNQGMPNPGMPNPVMPNPGMSNPGMSNPGMSNPGMSNPGMSNSGMLPSALQGLGMQAGGPGMQSYQSGGLPGMSNASIGNNSLFLRTGTGNSSIQAPNDIQMPNHPNQGNMYPMHGLQHSVSQAPFGNSIYSNIMQPPPGPMPNMPNMSNLPSMPNMSSMPNLQSMQNLSEQWYYEDPKKTVQGPFTSKEMQNWYRAGFFSPNLMVRRACEAMMRPLGTYGPLPFGPMDMLPPFPLSSGYDLRSHSSHDNMLNSQQGLGLDMMNTNMHLMPNNPALEPFQFGTVGHARNPLYGHQQRMVESLWGQPSSTDMMWMQQAINSRNESRINNLPMYFWDQQLQSSVITPNSLLPEEIAKEMKTEDQILAQLRATQNIATAPNLSFMPEPPPMSIVGKPTNSFGQGVNATPNLEELQKLIQGDTLAAPSGIPNPIKEPQNNTKVDNTDPESNETKQQAPTKVTAENKMTKQAKTDNDKTVKIKENGTKTKSKKSKEEKKEETIEVKPKEEEVVKAEKRSAESSPSKNKKEDKASKKELEKEKKEWLKEGFTIVKGTEKNTNKENKKKVDEVKVAEEAEKKKKEEDKLPAEEEKKKKQVDNVKKPEPRQLSESVIKRAPWSVMNNQATLATFKDGLTLGEIQRLEREKKLEQMREQQHMMHIIAQQQAAAMAREQEIQAGLGWAKKKDTLNNAAESLAQIQAEARKQAAAAAAAAAQVLEEAAVASLPPIPHLPWGNPPNGSGFWDTQGNASGLKAEKPQEPTKTVEPTKNKKKLTLVAPVKKETSPADEFESWCTTILGSWSSKIDVPTFVGFLKDIESPYEVKDYVKCYLGDSKDTNDFARQFLERRSKLLRVGMQPPSDDLCSPAIAINPRTNSGSDYQEVKGKGKKPKKNKMTKVDARILGFSVTAAEDRINVGDIDMA